MQNVGRKILAAALLIVGSSLATLAQDEMPSRGPVLIDEFSKVSECDFRGRLDNFLGELSEKPEYQGYVINYESVDLLPGVRGSYPREQIITNHFSFRNFDSTRITLVRGGYRTAIGTQLYILPPGAKPPEPTNIVPEPEVPEQSTFLFDKNYLNSETEEVPEMEEFILPAVKEREDAEFAARQAEIDAELSQGAGNEMPAEPADAAGVDPDSAETEEVPEIVDNRTAEEKEAEQFRWVDVGLAKFMSTRKGSTGVIIFYADDERYDVGKLRRFVEMGLERLAKSERLDKARFRIVFGGYRDILQAEFWFVPTRGKAPIPTPEERKVEAEEVETAQQPEN